MISAGDGSLAAGAHGISGGRSASWLLIKHRDEHADPSWHIERRELDRSVLTGRTSSRSLGSCREQTSVRASEK
jgi:hypothetical protein